VWFAVRRTNRGPKVKAFAEISNPMRLTVLTPSLDSETYLAQTLQSILSQEGDFDLQAIVIDGGSRDGTLPLLRSISDRRLRWISEPDRGQSAAVNKGLAMCEGDLVTWLNCDDLYQPGALAAVVKAFRASPSAQWLIGRCNIIDESGRVIRRFITRYKDHLLQSFSFKSLLRMNMINQPAVFWRRDFGQSVGPLDESLHWTMDYDLWLRMARRCPPLILSNILASFRVHRRSKSHGGHAPQFREGYRVARRYFGDDRASRLAHRFNVEKIAWGYRALRLMGR
jgi:glycosyltransferase involved in cell wall biosynthesis